MSMDGVTGCKEMLKKENSGVIFCFYILDDTSDAGNFCGCQPLLADFIFVSSQHRIDMSF